jgi:hypothetical protein
MIMKYWFILSSMFCFTSLALSADQMNDSSAPPPQPEGVTSQPKGVITPPVAPRVNHGADVFITADFIWWKAQVAGQDYVEMGSRKRAAHTKFEPGFKVGLGLDMDHDGWDVYAQYTWLYGPKHTTSTSTSSTTDIGYSTLADTEGVFLGIPDPTLTTAPATYASCSKKFTFNVLDVELGRNFFISKRLTLRPNVGLKFSWLNDKLTQTYQYEDTLGTVFSDQDQVTAKLKQHLFGVGIRSGVDTVWHFARSWGIYGDLAVTALWGSFHNKSTIKTYDAIDFEGNVFSETTSVARKQNSQDIIPVIEAGIGLTYMTWFYDESYMFSLKAVWEEQIWVNYNHIMNMPNNESGNLSMHGLTVEAGFAF